MIHAGFEDGTAWSRDPMREEGLATAAAAPAPLAGLLLSAEHAGCNQFHPERS